MSLVIKCANCETDNLVEVKCDTGRCQSCRRYLVMSNTQQVESLSPVEKIKQQRNILNALVSNNSLEQSDKDILNSSLGLIALESSSYAIAQSHFKKIIDENPTNAEARYYYTLSLLNGARPFLSNREQIGQLIQELNFAISLGAKGKYAYLKALIIYDFYDLKYIKYFESYKSVLEVAYALGVSEEEKAEMFKLLKMKRPSSF